MRSIKIKSRKRIAWSIVIAVLLLLVFVVPAAAAAQGEEIPTFDEALQYASGMGISVIVGFVVSVLLDYWKAYANLTPTEKRGLYAGLCLIVPVGAAALRGAMGYVAWSFDPLLWSAIWSGAAAAIIGTLVHNKVKRVASRQ